jgi:hypothetical protein
MTETMSQKLAVYGQWTYRGAWALEITAAIIGLMTGLALGYQAFAAGESVTAMELTLASAPFFMVALAELTKIPVATLLFSASWLWKPVLLVFLIALAAITFETVIIGLERAATLRQLKYDELAKQIAVLKSENQNLESTILKAQKDNRVEQAQKDIERISGLAEQERNSILQQIADLDRELEGQVLLSPEAARARDRLKEAEDRRSARLAERDRAIRDAVEEFERQRDSFVKRLLDPTATPEQKTAWEEELRRLSNPRPRIMGQYQSQIDSIDQEIASLRDEFETLRGTGEVQGSEQRKSLETRRSELVQSLARSDEKWSRERDAARGALGTAQSTEATETETIAANRTRQDQIAKELAAIEAVRIPMARTDQVRRLASRFHGVEPEDVSVEQTNFVAVIWFSSLAGLAALAGPLTAMVALGLQRIPESTSRKQESKLARFMRKWLVRWRFRRVRTIKVPVEKPVEKEVEKIVERPVEKIVKEILYVPVLTDDPDAVRRALRESLPQEVADLVKITTKTNGSPA